MKEKKQAASKATKATKPAKATKKATKQKQAKESLQERIRKAVESRAIYEELIEEGHEVFLSALWEGRAA